MDHPGYNSSVAVGTRGMFAVMGNRSARKHWCTRGQIWVKNDRHDSYVGIKERGLWPTREEATRMVMEKFEVVVGVESPAGEPDTPGGLGSSGG